MKQFKTTIIAYLESVGAERDPAEPLSYPFKLLTKAGLLRICVTDDDCIDCRFMDVENAKAFLPHKHNDRLNGYSGKWNFMFFKEEKVSYRLKCFKNELQPLLRSDQ